MGKSHLVARRKHVSRFLFVKFRPVPVPIDKKYKNRPRAEREPSTQEWQIPPEEWHLAILACRTLDKQRKGKKGRRCGSMDMKNGGGGDDGVAQRRSQ